MTQQEQQPASSRNEMSSHCSTCCRIPAELFTPGSQVTFEVDGGAEFVLASRREGSGGEGTGKEQEINCSLCTILYDALDWNSKQKLLCTDDGECSFSLCTKWAPSSAAYEREMWKKSRKQKYTIKTHNEILWDNMHRGETKEVCGPYLILLRKGREVGRLKFDLQSPGGKKEADEKGDWKINWNQAEKEESRAWRYTYADVSKPLQVVKKDDEPLPLSTAADSSEAFGLVNTWLDECMEKHEKCKTGGLRVVQSGFVLPTRLLDCEFENPRLVDGASLPRNSEGYGPPYVCLSHCWGDSDAVPKTLKDTLAAAREGIAFDTLSKTFQDTVVVTRRINVRYLWIDSLCIVQDDEAEKNRELTIMDLIYGMAICVVAASDALDGRGGCFTSRNEDSTHRRLQPYSATFQGSKKGQASIKIYPHLADWAGAMTSGKMYTRGWCFQERQLSKRMIYFTTMRVLWECREAKASEDHPEFVSDSLLRSQSAVKKPYRILDAAWNISQPTSWLRLDPEKDEVWMHHWCRVIEEYSGKQLGKMQEDRLKALAGLAATVSRIITTAGDPDNSFYNAGLWYKDLQRGLAWFPALETRVKQGGGESWPPPLIKAEVFHNWTISYPPTLPSWSWITIDGPVRYYHTRERQSVTPSIGGVLLDPRAKHLGLPLDYYPLEILGSGINLRTKGGNQFGAVSAGLLTLTGSVFKLSLSEADVFVPDGSLLDKPKCYGMFRSRRWSITKHFKPKPPEGMIYFDVDPDKLPEVGVTCLRLGTGTSLIDPTKSKTDFGLVLRTVESPLVDVYGQYPRYRRVGMFEVSMWHKEWLKEVYRETLHII